MCRVVGLCRQAQRVQNKEDMLAASGFTVDPANTPQREASLISLPPHKFVRQEQGGKVTYI